MRAFRGALPIDNRTLAMVRGGRLAPAVWPSRYPTITEHEAVLRSCPFAHAIALAGGPHHHHVADPVASPGSWSEIRMGTRAHTPECAGPAAVKRSALGPPGRSSSDRARHLR